MTKLLYLEDMCKLNSVAYVVDVIHADETIMLLLDQTVFYPQGGGQPADKGVIKNALTSFCVEGVHKENERVLHKGTLMKGPMFSINDAVEVEVDAALRHLHNRNHTAGHLIDYALMQLGYTFKPHKAYHFPQGPYIEYVGAADEATIERLRLTLEEVVNELVKQDIPVNIALIDNDLRQRTMSLQGRDPILCGGTHVRSTLEVNKVIIRKIKNEKGNLRISYAIA